MLGRDGQQSKAMSCVLFSISTHLHSTRSYCLSNSLPILTAAFWLTDILGLLGLWGRDNWKQYETTEATIVFISDVGGESTYGSANSQWTIGTLAKCAQKITHMLCMAAPKVSSVCGSSKRKSLKLITELICLFPHPSFPIPIFYSSQLPITHSLSFLAV